MITHGSYEVLASRTCDSLITDPPYGAGTHRGHDAGGAQVLSATGQRTRRALPFTAWTPDDVRAFIDFWAPRTAGWMAVFASHDLIDAYQSAYRAHGRYSFAPVSVIHKIPRLLGDGPASWTQYLMVSRPKSRHWQRWRCLPGAYFGKLERKAPIVGAKSLALMREIVRDYSDPGDTVCDPCAGWGTTLLAARELGRQALGSELDQATYLAAQARLCGAGYTEALCTDPPTLNVL
jgi:site-specific DNA-methyltransferase (adenine-specific)